MTDLYPPMQEEMRRQFFNFLNEREGTRIRKETSRKRGPWTKDLIIRDYRFCNVFREDDKTTRWFRENIREPLRNDQKVVFATFAFRWFNKIETAEKVLDFFLDPQENKDLNDEGVTEEDCARTTDSVYWALKDSKEAVTNGAYIIKTPDGVDKLQGVLWCIDQIPFDVGNQLFPKGEQQSLEGTWRKLLEFPFIGPFMSYEIVTDLRHTKFLENAPDIMTWANPGPGAVRGMERMWGLPAGKLNRMSQKVCGAVIEDMRKLLNEAHNDYPADFGPRMEMREIEGGLCEFDKYMRAITGEGRPKQRYHYGS